MDFECEITTINIYGPRLCAVCEGQPSSRWTRCPICNGGTADNPVYRICVVPTAEAPWAGVRTFDMINPPPDVTRLLGVSLRVVGDDLLRGTSVIAKLVAHDSIRLVSEV